MDPDSAGGGQGTSPCPTSWLPTEAAFANPAGRQGTSPCPTFRRFTRWLKAREDPCSAAPTGQIAPGGPFQRTSPLPQRSIWPPASDSRRPSPLITEDCFIVPGMYAPAVAILAAFQQNCQRPLPPPPWDRTLAAFAPTVRAVATRTRHHRRAARASLQAGG